MLKEERQVKELLTNSLNYACPSFLQNTSHAKWGMWLWQNRMKAPCDSPCSLFSFRSVQSLSRVWLFETPMNRSTPCLPVHHQVPESTQTHVHQVSDAIQPSHPLSSPSPPAPNPSQHQGLFQWVNSSHEVAFSFSINPSNEHAGLISFRMDWLDLLAVQGTLKSLLQHHSSKASILRRSQLSSQSNAHIHTWPLEKPWPWLDGPLLTK